MSPDAIAAAFLAACHAELQAMKPGNVHVHAAGHGMTVVQFEASAAAAAPHIASSSASIGERILRAVMATRDAVGQNTNLGIILLAAPIAAAAECAGSTGLRPALDAVLAGLDREDAALCFQAIALANPGGLGDVQEHDVRGPAALTLLEAMRLAADRDRIAYQYASGYADIFVTGIPAAREASNSTAAAAAVYWRFLTAIPDSHIARKYGAERAEAVRCLAQDTNAALSSAATGPASRATLLRDLDTRLKADGLNPGTSADLTVATLFAYSLL